jgi:hypothetical protein
MFKMFASKKEREVKEYTAILLYDNGEREEVKVDGAGLNGLAMNEGTGYIVERVV